MRSGMAERTRSTPVDRHGALDQVLRLCSTPRIRFVAITGPLGAGRSTLLAAAHDSLLTAGVPARVVRLTSGTIARPGGAARRLLEALNSLKADRHRGDRAVVLVDDVQLLDRAALDVTLDLFDRAVTVVGGVRTPVSHRELAVLSPWWRRALGAGVAATVGLRPLSPAAVVELVVATLDGAPSPDLVELLDRLAAGHPWAVRALLDGWRDSNLLRFSRGRVGLVDATAPVALARRDAILNAADELDVDDWHVLTAAATLYPLGDRMAAVIADLTRRSAEEVRVALHDLALTGLIRAPGSHRSWEFRPPLLATALQAHVGPWERARQAASAVTALQAADLTIAETDTLVDFLAAAGGLVDGERAYRAVVTRAYRLVASDPGRCARWTRTAARSQRSDTRLAALRLNAEANLLMLDLPAAVASARTALSEHRADLDAEHVDELTFIDRYAAHALGDDEPSAAVGLDALALRGDWCSVSTVLATDAVSPVDRLITRTASTLAGEQNGVAWLHADQRPARRSVLELTLVAGRIPLLIALGQYGRAAALLGPHAADNPLTATIAALIDPRRPWDELVELIADERAVGRRPAGLGEAIIAREAATILAGTGSLRRAVELIADPVTPVAEVIMTPLRAELAELMGDQERAVEVVAAGLARADAAELIAATDELLLLAATYAARLGADQEAAAMVARLDAVARRMGTTSARMNAAKGRFAVHRDPSAAVELTRDAVRAERPYEWMRAVVFLARYGHLDAGLIAEAHHLAGDLRALLWRARLRRLMRGHGMAVANRQQAVRENEELLATMVTDGLTNHEIAVAILVSDKSVEGYLSRLFQRRGYRSRVDLATGRIRRDHE